MPGATNITPQDTNPAQTSCIRVFGAREHTADEKSTGCRDASTAAAS